MRRIREITAEEENFRTEEVHPGMVFVKREPIKPEPEGTIILVPFRVTGYDPDCDGSLLARLAAIQIDDFSATGWKLNYIGLYPSSGIVVTETELHDLCTKLETASK